MVLGSRTGISVYSGILARHENTISTALRFMKCINVNSKDYKNKSCLFLVKLLVNKA